MRKAVRRRSEADSEWVQHGGRETMNSYKAIIKEQKNVHIGFFGKMVHYITDPDKRLYVHAGFSSMRGPENEHFESAISIGTVLVLASRLSDGQPIEKGLKIFPLKRLKLYNEICLSWAYADNELWDRSSHARARMSGNVDTGAAYSKGPAQTRLDVRANTKEYWQERSGVEAVLRVSRAEIGNFKMNPVHHSFTCPETDLLFRHQTPD